MFDLKNINYLVGDKKILNSSTVPYNEKVCQFIAEFSEELNNNKESKKFPDLKTLAFWCRKKNILNFKKKFLTEKTRVGLGLLFHITPSNIPTNFAYSLIFGLITGNSNIVKVPSKNFEQISIICKVLNKILAIKSEGSSILVLMIFNFSDNSLILVFRD